MRIGLPHGSPARCLAAAALLRWVVACGGVSASPDRTPEPPPPIQPNAALTAPAPQPGPSESRPFVLYRDRSRVRVVAQSLLGDHPVMPREFSGRALVVERDLAASSIRVEIDMRSVEADSELLTDLMRSPRVLDVERYPTATFVSRHIRRIKRGAERYLIAGDLTLHGVTRYLEVSASVTRRAETFRAHTTFTVRRQDYEIRPGGLLELFVHDEVRVEIEVVALPEMDP